MPKESSTLRSTRPTRKTDQTKISEELYEYQDIKNVLHKHQQKQVGKSTARLTAFHERKQSLYAHARKTAKDISTSGITY
ncbi:hypothetical protein M378DRAFT_21244, partial [Amanita muscaria Koide BX008]